MSPKDSTIAGQKSDSAFAREGEGMCPVKKSSEQISEPEIETLNPEKRLIRLRLPGVVETFVRSFGPRLLYIERTASAVSGHRSMA
jgi:hypothetical protein